MIKNGKKNVPFVFVWAGQTFSLWGAQLSMFALGIWLYLRTGSVIQFGLLMFFSSLPRIISMPLVGVLVDHFSRRLVLITCEVVNLILFGFLLILLINQQLELHFVYLVICISALFSGAKAVAYNASIPLLVPNEAQRVRANAMVQLGLSIGMVVIPIVAASLLQLFGLEAVVAFNLLSIILSLLLLINVNFPELRSHNENRARLSSRLVLTEIVTSLSFIRRYKELFILLLLFAIVNFITAIVTILLTPLVLSFATVLELGFVTTSGGIGMLVGSLLMNILRFNLSTRMTLFSSMTAAGACIALCSFQPSIVLLCVGFFGFSMCIPIVMVCSASIWQLKVPLEMQGKVLSLRSFVAYLVTPIAYLIAPLLAENFFEPLMNSNTWLSSVFSRVVGIGDGRGMALMFFICGLSILIISLVSMHLKILLRLEMNDKEPTENLVFEPEMARKCK